MFTSFEWVVYLGKSSQTQTTKFGVCLFSLQGLALKVNSLNLQELKTLVSKQRPAEIYYDRFQTPLEVQ